MNNDQKKWLPLESDPETMNELARKLGLKEDWQINELFGLDEELLAFISQPVLAVILLFEHKEEVSKGEGKEGANGEEQKLFFVKQIKELGDACGTIALIHALSNNPSVLKEESVLKTFVNQFQGKSPQEVGQNLVNYEAIKSLHDGTAVQGSQESLKEETRFHYICFLHRSGYLWEIDGCKEGPQSHGPTDDQSFFADSTKLIKESFFEKLGGISFSMMVLNKSQE